MTKRDTHHTSKHWSRWCAILFLGLGVLMPSRGEAIGEAATYFGIFVPPNNDNNGRDVCLVVTALNSTPTTVDIVDDGADGDTDDTVQGITLTKGQSYIVYLKDGGVNDDAGGKWDGDYFKVNADHPVVVQMATRSNWQHDWVPSQGKSSKGTSFFVWAPPTSGHDNDINVYAYEDDTLVEIEDISSTPTINSGASSVDLDAGKMLLSQKMAAGEDLIVRNNLGIDILDPGHTYWVRSNKEVTVQYGHLGSLSGGNSVSDGGGFIPSNNGSSVGDLFYFSIPYRSGGPGEKELRVVSYDNDVTFTLMGWNANTGGYDVLSQHTMQRLEHLDFVGHTNPKFRDADLYKVVVSPPGKSVTLFEASWLETGSSGTSDFASAISSSNGYGAGTEFVTYLGPPGYQNRWSDLPQTGGTRFSHVVTYAYADNTTIRVRDADTLGTIFDETVTIQKGDYHDFAIDLTRYNLMNQSGNRPYVYVTSSEPISAHNNNFNDNWMAYATSPMVPDPYLETQVATDTLECGQSTSLTLSFGNSVSTQLQSAALSINLPQGIVPSLNALTSNHPDITGTTASLTPLADGTTKVSWPMPQGLGATSMHQMTLPVTLDCNQVQGCLKEGLADIQTSITGDDIANDTYANQASSLVTVRNDSLNHVVDIAAFYDTTQGGARVGFQIGPEDGTGFYEVTRSTSPDATPQVVAYLNSHGASTTDSYYWFSDFSVNLGRDYFYRVNLDRGNGCLTTYGPFYVKLDANSSAGVNGGLESNGRLADQLAIRAIERQFLACEAIEEKPLQSSEEGVLTDPKQLLPTEGPSLSEAVLASPADLGLYTNAKGVAAADYIDKDLGRIGTVLVLKTEGEVYEHSKALCDRSGGSVLYNRRHESLEPFISQSLMHYQLVNARENTNDYVTSFKLYETPATSPQSKPSFKLYSTWLRRHYPTPSPEQNVYNVQVWASVPGYEAWLAQHVMAKFADFGDITLDDEMAPEPQNTPFFHKVGALGSLVHLTLDHVTPTTKATLRFKALSELTGDIVVTEKPLEIANAKEGRLHVEHQLERFIDVTVELVMEDKVKDEVWLSDGTWASFMDTMWGGASEMLDLSLNECDANMATLTTRDAALELGEKTSSVALSGCAKISSKVDDFAGIARHLGGSLAPLEMSTSHMVSAWVVSQNDVEACVHSKLTPGLLPLCTTWKAAPEGAWRTMHLGEIEREPHVQNNHFKSIYLITFGSSAKGTTLNLSVSHLEVHDNMPPTYPEITDAPNKPEVPATPVVPEVMPPSTPEEAPAEPVFEESLGGCQTTLMEERAGRAHVSWISFILVLITLILNAQGLKRQRR